MADRFPARDQGQKAGSQEYAGFSEPAKFERFEQVFNWTFVCMQVYKVLRNFLAEHEGKAIPGSVWPKPTVVSQGEDALLYYLVDGGRFADFIEEKGQPEYALKSIYQAQALIKNAISTALASNFRHLKEMNLDKEFIECHIKPIKDDKTRDSLIRSIKES